jgi:hypothetical protein
MAAAPSARGYWMVASDAGVVSFGIAPDAGSGAQLHQSTAATFLGLALAATRYQLAPVAPSS